MPDAPDAFTLRIKTSNAAFRDENVDDEDSDVHADAARQEVARILRSIADRIDAGDDSGTIHDSNGNSVGRYDLG